MSLYVKCLLDSYKMEGNIVSQISNFEQTEIEKLKTQNTLLEARLHEETIQKLEAKIKMLETVNQAQLVLKEEQIANQKLQFELERASWKSLRCESEPKAKVAKVGEAGPPSGLRKAPPDSMIYKIESTVYARHHKNAHLFLDNSGLFEEENVFPYSTLTVSKIIAEVAAGMTTSKSGKYRVLGLKYEGPRVSSSRLRRFKYIKEAYGVQINDNQYLVLVLFEKNSVTLDFVPSVITQVIPVLPDLVSVYTEGSPTPDTILATIKHPSKFKWMYNINRF